MSVPDPDATKPLELDNDLTDQDVNAVPSANEPDEMDGTAEATDEGLDPEAGE